MTSPRNPMQAQLDWIAEVVTAMSPTERVTAARVFTGVLQAFALSGTDDAIGGARVLSACVDLLLIADREERRATERQATL